MMMLCTQCHCKSQQYVISPAPSDESIIMYQLKPIKQYIYHKNKQLDDMFLSVGDGDVNRVEIYMFCIFIYTI